VYNANGNVIATIDPAGKVTRTYYDELQRPTVLVDNLVGQAITVTTAPAYDPDFPDRNVRTTTVYDAAGNAVQTVDNANLATYFCYDALNRVVKTIQNPTVGDPCADYTPSSAADEDLIQQTVYDNGGNVIATIDPAGRITRTYYDVLNRPSAVIQNLVGQAITVTTPPAFDDDHPDRNVGSQTFYDDAGRADRQLDLTTNRSDWTCFDSAGRVVRTVQNASGATPCAGGYTPSGQPDEDVITEFVYDAAGRQIATIAPDGQITRTYFDADGRRSEEVVNLVGQAITVTTPPTFNALYPDQNITTRFGYDALGRVITTTLYADSPQQRTDWTCYDALGRNIRSVTNASGAGACDPGYTPSSDPAYDLVNSTVYDLAGQAIGQVDAAGTIARTYLDRLYRPVVTVQNLTGQTITNTTPPSYDSAFPDANVRQETRYDDAGRAYEQEDNSGMVTHTGFDELGRPITVTTDYANGGPAVVTLYDKLGNATRQVDAEGVVTAYEYDGLNRWTAAVQNYKPGFAATADQNVRTEFTYDARGNRLTQTDPQGNVTQFAYDALNRQVSVTDPLTHTTVYTYNTTGLWIGQLDANGAETTFAYDGLRRRIAIDYPADTTDVSFSYDAAGNRIAMTDTVGTTSWAYDVLGRPLTVTAPLTGSVSYRYDHLGNRTHLLYPDGRMVTTTHTALNQVSGLTDWTGQATGFEYDAAGRPLTTTLPNGVTSAYRYDTAHRLGGLSHTTITGTVANYTYTLDARGNWQTA